MTFRLRPDLAAVLAISLMCAPGSAPKLEAQERDRSAAEAEFPDRHSQQNAILKADREQNMKDAERLAQLAGELKIEIEKNESYVLPLATIRKTDEIEKLVKKIRARLRHD